MWLFHTHSTAVISLMRKYIICLPVESNQIQTCSRNIACLPLVVMSFKGSKIEQVINDAKNADNSFIFWNRKQLKSKELSDKQMRVLKITWYGRKILRKTLLIGHIYRLWYSTVALSKFIYPLLREQRHTREQRLQWWLITLITVS